MFRGSLNLNIDQIFRNIPFCICRGLDGHLSCFKKKAGLFLNRSCSWSLSMSTWCSNLQWIISQTSVQLLKHQDSTVYTLYTLYTGMLQMKCRDGFSLQTIFKWHKLFKPIHLCLRHRPGVSWVLYCAACKITEQKWNGEKVGLDSFITVNFSCWWFDFILHCSVQL